MIRLLFLIRSLGQGGAERQLIELVRGLDKSRFDITVATLYPDGELLGELRAVPSIHVESLNKRSRWDVVPVLWRLLTLLRRLRPQIAHGQMDTGNLLALLAGKLSGAKVVWGVRSSFVDFARFDPMSARLYRLTTRLSHHADLIVANSSAGRQHAAANGYETSRMVVIPNGIDVERFTPDAGARKRLRSEWDVADREVLIGIVARFDPLKDHETFLRAAALLAARRDDVRFAIVGGGAEDEATRLRALAGDLGISSRVIWAGARSDVAACYNALDLLVSSSYGEGFSNAIAEAMACGIACVVTDAGDSAWLVEGSGVVVPVKDPEALAGGCEVLLSSDRQARAGAARSRIEDEFSRERLAAATARALETLR
jgi:glycosyltransferase involved in cell wall biosynthesis